MDKILIGSIIGSIVGVIVGGFITLLVSYKVQNKQFAHDREVQNDIYRSLLDTLIQEIKYIDKKLKENGDIFSEYYDVSIQNEIIIKLLDTELFFKNRNVFDDIRSLTRYLLILNIKIENYKLIVRENPSYWKPEVDAKNARSLNEVKDYKNFILKEINFQDIIEKLENIKNSIE